MKTIMYDVDGNFMGFERWRTKNAKCALNNQMKLLDNELYSYCMHGAVHEIKVIDDSDCNNERIVIQKFL
jgi:hypothetical protein